MNELKDRVEWSLCYSGTKATELASHLGVNRSAIYAWLNGNTKEIAPRHLFIAARFLGVEPEWLGTGKGPRTSLEIEIQNNTTVAQESRAFITTWSRLSYKHRALIWSLMDALRESAHTPET